ncbi:MAG TPA: peptidylprolyl isomerase [Caulobacteraceae bacterium]|jgi:peptidyl-prolyl cis-trans isomerase A (cyclophilin A)|nr:peptidylprolyl isomerase [Caulobacteraceae bacterium]
MFSRRTAIAGALVAWPALAQSALPRVKLTTPLGGLEIELAIDKAPITAGNFLAYVDQKRLDGASFYRAMKLAPNPPLGLIQGGLQGNPAKVLPAIAHEPTTKTGLKHIDGVISLARYAPGTATCDFFICIGDQPSLDADPSQSGDNAGFAAFGRLTGGADVARAILAAHVSPTAGEGVMKGEMLDPPIAILTARRSG